MRTQIHRIGDQALREWAVKRQGCTPSVPSLSVGHVPSGGFGGQVPRG